MNNKPDRLHLRDCRITYKNFAGRTDEFNPRGDRTFAVIIEDPAVAEKLINDGWPLKVFNTHPDDELPPNHFMTCKINLTSSYPPRIWMINSEGKRLLDERTIGVLDMFPVETVDVDLNAYHWEVGNKTGVKPYVETLYAVINQAEIDQRYAELPDITVFPAE